MSVKSAIFRWWTDFTYSPYDRRRNFKWLAGREADRAQLDLPGVPQEIRDNALKLFCESFQIPARQMYCLRLNDPLATIYREMNGPRSFDQFQFEWLFMVLDELPGAALNAEQIAAITTVADVIREVARRRGFVDGSA